MFWRTRGFTLVELLVALTVSALLMAVAVPVYESYAERSRVGQAIADIGTLDMLIERFSADHFRLPDDLAELPGPAVTDPWGRPYRYLRIEGAGPGIAAQVRKDRNLVPINSDYDLYSAGADGDSRPPLVAPPSRDDVVRAGNGGFIGSAESF